MKWFNNKHRYPRILLAVLLTSAVVSLTACQSSKQAGSTQNMETTASDESVSMEVLEDAVTEKKTEESDGCGILRGTVIDGSDYSESITIRTDNGNDYNIFTTSVPLEEITTIKPSQKVAIAYSGTVEGEDLQGVQLVVTLNPQVQYEIKTVTGVTVSNAMSTFIVKDSQGQEISFMKDNCEMEENSLSKDSGDEVKVVYVTSTDTEINYPLKISKAQ